MANPNVKNIRRAMICYLTGIYSAERALEFIAKEIGIKAIDKSEKDRSSQ